MSSQRRRASENAVHGHVPSGASAQNLPLLGNSRKHRKAGKSQSGQLAESH